MKKKIKKIKVSQRECLCVGVGVLKRVLRKPGKCQCNLKCSRCVCVVFAQSEPKDWEKNLQFAFSSDSFSQSPESLLAHATCLPYKLN